VANGSAAQVQSFVNTTAISFPVLMNASSINATYDPISGYSLIIDRKGLVQYVEYGVNAAKILDKLKQLQASSIRRVDSQARIGHCRFLNGGSPGKLDFWLTVERQEEVSIAIYNCRGQALYGPVYRSFAGGLHRILINKPHETGVGYAVIKGATFTYVHTSAAMR
jgi:hypothetical protein